ncbi:peptide deformylase [Ancylomarina sp. 16SWW S1-10-2]|uniref:peptide deformylase n=1 Tax=Ancylomarina sp. 16SWW S1-10-2 TaxID=2499681 RepID=UPI0012AE24E0|nr:peptide deformylase [Ancylomarina sp. 16SWW S1-10-2]MRT93503.1 peptide deformylase [Ancylomarina sp. 16SWW S1-10-2]
MILPITIYGHPVLRKVAKDIDKDYPDLEKFMADMWQSMYFSDGVGLAAPQVGRSIRMFVLDCSSFEEEEPELKDFKKMFINAHITDRNGEEWSMSEGCLSIPKLNEDVMRPETIRIEYYDENWEFHDEEYSGFAARVIQHEYDHLEGILFTDHCSPLRKRLLKSKLTAISKGKFDVKYRFTLAK